MVSNTLTIPDRATAITAWRGWEIGHWFGCVRVHLLSVHHHSLQRPKWPARRPMAAYCPSCSKMDGDMDEEWMALVGAATPNCPMESCNCGIYGMKTPRGAQGSIRGQVLLWGKVLEHETGYRAQYAYPSVLYLPSNLWWFRHGLRKAYGEIKVLPLPLLPQG